MTTNAIQEQLHSVSDRLDVIEERLPAFPSALMSLSRTVGGRVIGTASAVADGASRRVSKVAKTSSTGLKTVVGTAEYAADEAAATAATGARTVAGQAKAQARQASDTLQSQAESLATDTKRAAESAGKAATDAVDAAAETLEDAGLPSNRPYDSWTRDELYERAQELDIDGRSGMNKRELIAALRQAQ